MRNREMIEKQLKDYGFIVHHVVHAGNLETLNGLSLDGINVTVDVTDEETFSIIYLVPHSVARVTIGPCAPFRMQGHFEKMLRKMKSIVSDLQNQ